MFDEEISKIAAIACVIIVVFIGAIAIPAVFKAPDQIVQNSGNQQLQSSYQTGKEMIDQAGNLQDGSDLAKSVANLAK